MALKNRFADLHAEITAWRRDFHAHPELRFEEHRTAARVAELLRDFGCDEVVEGVGQTGVVGVIRGREAGSGRVVGFRADMDALPLTERTGLAHASTVPGKMHACGHDGHTAILLGAAKYLAETRNFDGTLVLAFQPAEEGGGGARAMIADGLMDRWGIQEVYGLHNWPGVEVGSLSMRAGPILAAADRFEIVVRGRGGHGAMPHLSIDPTLAAAHVVVALQSIVARTIDPLEPAVVSVCGLRSETDTYNVIADSVTLKGTFRSFNSGVRETLIARIKEITRSTARAHGTEAEVTFHPGVGPTVNAVEPARHAAEAARTVAGTVIDTYPPVMGGEDFSDMLAQRPGAYLFLGNGGSAGLHHPEYEFNDEAIPAGCSWFATLAEQRMPLT